jgi:hypothetical protein
MRAAPRSSRPARLFGGGYSDAFSLEAEPHGENLELIDRFLSDQMERGNLDPERRKKGARMWRVVAGTEVAQMLTDFRVSGRSRRADGRLLSE